VGISGAVCGLLGFLLVFETLHRPLVPSPARRRMFGILVSLIVIGFVGFRFIDNAAHCGGLLTGAAYAAIVFPKSAALSRPHILKQDRLMGGASVALAVFCGLAAMVIMLTH
jgi:membrane associated rhomboid family serine protease